MITTKETGMVIEQLKKIEIVKNKWLGDRWVPINHGILAETINNRLTEHNIKVKNQSWFPSGPNLGELVGRVAVEIPGENPIEGTDFNLGVIHSNNGERALRFVVGAQVFVCGNGVVSGDFILKRKHTSGLDLVPLIDNGIELYLDKIGELVEVTDTMKDRGLSTKDVDRILMTAGRNGIMSWSRIGQVDEEYHNPIFSEFKEKTAWSLYNCFTHVMQKMPSQYHMEGMNRFREVVLS